MQNTILISVALVFLSATTSLAQNQRQEFIESSSPLKSGGKVVSRSTPESEIQTIATGTTDSVRDIGPTSILDRRPNNDNLRRESVFRQATPSSTNVGGTAPRYPYPAANLLPASRLPTTGRTQQTALFYQPVRATATCTNCAAPYQISTLGLSNTVQTARQSYGQAVAPGNNCCNVPTYGSTTALAVPAAQAPVLQIQPPANQVPSLAIQDPGQSGFNFQTPVATNLGNPQFGGPRNNFLSPFVNGSGVYQPIIRLANMPPGTYLGQGIIGQPTAYVDGQPIRNLLRYISP